MKTIYILMIILVFAGVSCDNFLDEELQGRYTSQTFYKTQDQAMDAVTSAYNSLLFNNNDNSLWVFGDVASDDAVKGSLPGDQLDIQYIDQFNMLSSNSELLKMWQCYYEGVSRSNIALYYVPNIAMDEELKSRLLGEVKFLRAFYYFHLTNIFGNIPLKLTPPLTEADINVPASDVTQIYTQIEKDLNEAIAVLPVAYSPEIGRVTQGAALGMLAKVYLFEGKYQDVLQTIGKIDALGIYGLTQVYRENFEAPTQENQETVFAVHHLRGSNPSLGSYLNVYFGPRGPDSTFNFGYAFDAPVQDFVDEFEMTADSVVDPRLDYTIGRPGTKWINGEDYKSSWSQTTSYLSKKHIQPFSEVSSSFADSYLNYVYMRYADILLMKAEALNELGQTPQALTPLNMVRKRARESYLYDTKLPGNGTVPADLLPDISSTSQSEVRTAIRHERRVELGFEFHRYFDLMRYGKEAAEAALAGTSFSYEKNRYFPIPLLETENNPMLH
jgi:starch-binding outer membrane protein, SusD/RagB family